MPFTIDIDTGGTFTDGFVTNGATAFLCKVETTPHDLTVCFVDCLEAIAQRLGLDVRQMLARTAVVRYSSTVGTNALLQRTGPDLGLFVTRGTESLVQGHPLVRPELVLGLDEQVDESGRVVRPLESPQVRAGLERLLDLGAGAVCISLANSDVNPAHERHAGSVIAAEYPLEYLGSVRVFAASDVTIWPGLLERTNAAIVTAYLHNHVATYLYRAEDYLREHGYRRGLLIVHNTGNVSRVVTSTALNTYNSGPVAGLYGAQQLAAAQADHDVVITMDIGGTSLDVGVLTVEGLCPSRRPVIHGMPVNVPMIEVDGFAIGGGSIARVADGRVTVGPESAGSLPGPAAYDLGGTEPTVTDADLVLGRLASDTFFGGRRTLNVDSARQALATHIAEPLGVTIDEAARRVVAAATEKIAGVLTAQLSQRGIAPERATLLAVGGGSGLRCAEAGRAVGVRRVVSPRFGSVFCAQGASMMDVKHIYEARSGQDDAAATRAELRARALHDIQVEGFTPDDADWTEENERLPSHVCRVIATCRIPHYAPVGEPECAGDGTEALIGRRPVVWNGEPVVTPVYDRDRMVPGHTIRGPALVESGDTTVAVPPGAHMGMDGYRNAVVTAVGGER